MSLFAVCLVAAVPHLSVPTNEIAPGVHYPVVQIGCCTKNVSVSLKDWLDAQPPPNIAAIDTAYGYKDQTQIAAVLAEIERPRESLFITSKIPGGLVKQGGPCQAADPTASALQFVQDNLKQLNVSYVDLMLLHEPCDMSGKPSPLDRQIWLGLQQAVKKGWARAIGVDRMLPAQIEALLEAPPNGTVHKPAVMMASINLNLHDDSTISFCKSKGIQYNGFSVMKGCKFTNPTVVALARKYSVSTSQVCGRWALQRVGSLALSSGCDPATAPAYTKENLAIFSFALSATEMVGLDALGGNSTAMTVTAPA
jgi:diketogulonate reductase-like aldo/keto reductase